MKLFIFNALFFCALTAASGAAGQLKPHFNTPGETVAQIMADTASVNSPDIDRVWSPALQYVVIIPQKADREIYPILKRILNDPVYTMQNTLILYPSQLENSIRKVNTAYQLLLFPMELFDSDPKQIVAASIEDIKSSRSTYHYKIVKQKIYK